MTLLESGQLYERAQTCQIWDEPVEFAPTRQFVYLATTLIRELGEMADSNLWRDPVRLLRTCRRNVCTVPLPYSSPELQLSEAGRRLLAWTDGIRGIITPDQMDLIAATAAALSRLAAEDCDPLGTSARDFLTLDALDKGILVVTSRQHAEAVKRTVAPGKGGVRIGTYADLQGAEVFSSAALVGPPSWVPPRLLNSPRAHYLAVVHHDFFRDSPEVKPLFSSTFGDAVASRGVARNVERSKPRIFRSSYVSEPPTRETRVVDTEPLSEDECSPAEEILAELRHESARQGVEATAGPAIAAQVGVLAERSHVLLPVESDVRILSVDVLAEPGHRVEQVPASSVSHGNFLALRAQSYHHDLVSRADALLGSDAARLRAVQTTWKRQLGEQAQRHPGGIAGVAADIRRLGATTANISYWTSSWCIRTRSQADFAVVMRYLGRGQEASAVWQDLSRIDNAHRRAGHRSADSLEQALTPQLLVQLMQSGWSKVTLPGETGPTIIARLDDFLPGIHHVPAHLLCSLRALKESG